MTAAAPMQGTYIPQYTPVPPTAVSIEPLLFYCPSFPSPAAHVRCSHCAFLLISWESFGVVVFATPFVGKQPGVVADTSPQTVAPSSQDTSGQQQQIAVDTSNEHAPAYSYQQSK
ncbi:RNA binding motif, single stranded interacting protein 3 [Saguinus oedipus]|uniref:RNA binding motif, single stranded interacting protein 3 n=1 Tax=Saguinus oedipus TaxID=9490 RepID=A0ABQ9TZL3_SAGOE|nr:RNA binding motif, single stranded interacting protein 3 [Saguinus oedipus]